jgi:hypothetical protein
MYAVVTGNVYVCMAAFVEALLPERQGIMRETDAKEGEFYCTEQHPPPVCGAYGSSFLPTGPHTDGTCIEERGISTGIRRSKWKEMGVEGRRGLTR